MLITDDKRGNEGVLVPHISGPSDIPPPYDLADPLQPQQLITPSTASLHNSTVPRPLPPNIPASHYLKIRRDVGSIEGTYAIDVGHAISTEAASDSNSQKHLSIRSSCGSVAANIWVVSETPRDGQRKEKKPAELEVKSSFGSVSVKLNTATADPFALNAYSACGSVSVAIPSDFVGAVFIKTGLGSISLLGTMGSRLTRFSETGSKREYFIGDARKSNYTGRQKWTGSIIEIGSSCGEVELAFADDPKAGFLRMFSAN